VRDASYTGAELHLTITLPEGGELVVETPEANFTAVPPTGTAVRLAWDADDLTLLPAADGDGRS